MTRWSLWAAIAVMLVVQGFSRILSEPLAVAAALAGTALLIGLARLDGLSYSELGIAGGTDLLRGLRWGAIAVGLVGLFYAALLATPFADVLHNDRTPETLSATLVQVLITIPIQTVLWEEVAFRGVLWALINRDHGWRTATIVSSTLFGLWHILPAITFANSSGAVATGFGSAPVTTIATVVVTVLFTGSAGVVFCELRRRSGSLLAPMGAHWATNGLGTLASFLA